MFKGGITRETRQPHLQKSTKSKVQSITECYENKEFKHPMVERKGFLCWRRTRVGFWGIERAEGKISLSLTSHSQLRRSTWGVCWLGCDKLNHFPSSFFFCLRGGVICRFPPIPMPPYGYLFFFSAGFNIWKEHNNVSSTLIMAPALSNSPQ